MLLQLLLSPKNTSCLDDSSEDKSGTSIDLPAKTKDSSGGQWAMLSCLLEALHKKTGIPEKLSLTLTELTVFRKLCITQWARRYIFGSSLILTYKVKGLIQCLPILLNIRYNNTDVSGSLCK